MGVLSLLDVILEPFMGKILMLTRWSTPKTHKSVVEVPRLHRYTVSSKFVGSAAFRNTRYRSTAVFCSPCDADAVNSYVTDPPHGPQRGHNYNSVLLQRCVTLFCSRFTRRFKISSRNHRQAAVFA